MVQTGLKRGTWKYTGLNSYNKGKFKQLQEMLKGKSDVFIVALIDNQVVGMASYHPDKGRTRHRVDCAWSVHPDFSGRGIATKVVQAMCQHAKKSGFKRMEAEVALQNIGSLKVAEKNGFCIEGTKKRALLLDSGRYADTHMLGKLLT